MSVKYFKNGQLTLIAGAGGISGGGDCDCDSKIFTGTAAEYEAQKDNIEDGTIINITDDIEEGIFIDIEEVLNKIAELEADVEDIKQNGSGASSADNVTYDSTASGLEAATVQEAIDEMKEDFGGLRFGTDGEGNYGYFKGDDTFVPFKSGEVTVHYDSWILAGGLNPTEYATLDELLEDEAAVRTLMTKKIAVDILTTLDKTELDTIIRHRYAAKWINYREYAYSKLSAIENIKDIMDETGMYGMYITTEAPKALVPTLTSNTGSDGGEASVSDFYGGYPAYRAFGGNSNIDTEFSWITNNDKNTDQWIQYKFTVPTIVTEVKFRTSWQNQGIPRNIKIQGSNDGSNFIDIYVGLNIVSTVKSDVSVNISYNNQAFMYWRFYIVDSYVGDYNRTGIATLQFYGYQCEALIPTLTSNTGTNGVASASSAYDTNHQPYMAFNGVNYESITGSNDTGWMNATYNSDGSTNNPVSGGKVYIQYQFTNPTNVNRLFIGGRKGSQWYQLKKFKFLASNNGSNWTELGVYETGIVPITKPSANIVIDNDNYYTYYRINPIETYGNSNNSVAGNLFVYIVKLQLYSEPTFWQPKGLVPVMTSNTAPYGSTSVNSTYDNTGTYYGYKAFDGVDTTGWAPAGSPTVGNYLGYTFVQPTCVTRLYMRSACFSKFKLQGTNDGVAFVDVSGDIDSGYVTGSSSAATITVDIDNDKYYMGYRIFVTDIGNNVYSTNINTLQFYGRQLEALIPPMTSNTAPMGTVSTSGEVNATYAAWKAFDSDETTTKWLNLRTSSITNQWLMYEFPNAVIANCFSIKWAGYASAIKYLLQGSNNNDTWDDLTGVISDSSAKNGYQLNTSKAYKYYRLYIQEQTMKQTSYSCGDLYSLQLYGAPDYESRTYIYDHGVEVMPIIAYKQNAGDVVEKKNDYLYMETKKTGNYNVNMVHDSLINLSPYKLCTFTVDKIGVNVESNILLAVLQNSRLNYGTSYTAGVQKEAEASKALLDLSNINSALYVVIATNSNIVRQISVASWWLE